MKEMQRTGMVQQPNMFYFSLEVTVFFGSCLTSILNFMYVEKCKFPKDGSFPKSLRSIGRILYDLPLVWTIRVLDNEDFPDSYHRELGFPTGLRGWFASVKYCMY
ncbi:hypothetical protein PTKIN_Ptkin01aG0133300 [Pterospermum kingtungense]